MIRKLNTHDFIAVCITLRGDLYASQLIYSLMISDEKDVFMGIDVCKHT